MSKCGYISNRLRDIMIQKTVFLTAQQTRSMFSVSAIQSSHAYSFSLNSTSSLPCPHDFKPSVSSGYKLQYRMFFGVSDDRRTSGQTSGLTHTFTSSRFSIH